MHQCVSRKGNFANFTRQSMFRGLGDYYCVKPDKLPQMMSLESALVVAEDYV